MWGLAPIPSDDGFQFYLILFDEFSRYIWSFLIAQKSDISQTFSKVLKLMENQFNTHKKIIQNNGGGEFVNHILKNYFSF